MKLLLDQNLSRRLLPVLEEAFPGSRHVVQLGMEQASDIAIWEYAAANDFVIETGTATSLSGVSCWAIRQRFCRYVWGIAGCRR